MYVDLSSDEKIDNETMISLNEVKDVMRTILKPTDIDTRKTLFESIIISEPFIQFDTDLRKAFERGDFDD